MFSVQRNGVRFDSDAISVLRYKKCFVPRFYVPVNIEPVYDLLSLQIIQ